MTIFRGSRATIEKDRLSVSISKELRGQLEKAREESGRSLPEEVEARLRESLGSGRQIILLRPDEGLMVHLIALQRCHFVGDMEDLIIYLIRTELIAYMGKDNGWWSHIAAELPEPYRSHHFDAQAVFASRERA